MKRTLLLFGLVVFSSIGQLKAQDGLGIKVGLNTSTVKTNESTNGIDVKSIVSPLFGFTKTYDSEGAFFVRTEFLFSQKGSEINYSDVISDGGNAILVQSKFTSRATYIQIPLYFGVEIETGEKTNLMINGGPYVALGITGKWSSEAQIGTESIDFSGDIKFANKINRDNANNFNEGDIIQKFSDFGLNFGLGYQISQFILAFDMNLGLSSITPDIELPGASPNDDEKVRYQGASFTLSYRF